MSSRPKNPKYARNKNILVIGGSGSGKTRFFVKPSLPFSASFVLIFLAKGGHSMQEKTAAGKTGTSNKSLDEKTTYRFGNRSFVVEPVFRQDGPDTLGSILLRLMKSESEAK